MLPSGSYLLQLMSGATFLTSCSMGQIPTSGSSTNLPFFFFYHFQIPL